MTGLFLSFDFSYSIFVLIWLRIVLLVSPDRFWIIENKISNFFNTTLASFSKRIKSEFNFNYNSGFTWIFLSLFIYIYCFNLIGLLGYTYPVTRFYIFTGFLRLIFWTRMMIIGIINNLFKNLSHLITTGTPVYIMSFIILIEIVRILIRPLTLRIRLFVNISAGQVLLSLARWRTSYLIFGQFLLFILENIVALIQAYIFFTLTTLYLKENL